MPLPKCRYQHVYSHVRQLVPAAHQLCSQKPNCRAYLLSNCYCALSAVCLECRALAYEAVGLCLAALAASSSKSTQQVQLLLDSIKRSLTHPFQQLPGVIAMFAAEAVYVLMAPGSAMYSPVNKLLLKRPALNIEVSTGPGSDIKCDHDHICNVKLDCDLYCGINAFDFAS